MCECTNAAVCLLCSRAECAGRSSSGGGGGRGGSAGGGGGHSPHDGWNIQYSVSAGRCLITHITCECVSVFTSKFLHTCVGEHTFSVKPVAVLVSLTGCGVWGAAESLLLRGGRGGGTVSAGGDTCSVNIKGEV